MGAVGSVAVRWSRGGGVAFDGTLTTGVLQAVVRARGYGVEPDSERICAIDQCAGAGSSGAAFAPRGDLWRGSSGATHVAAMGQAQRRKQTTVGKHVWDHRDDRTCDIPCADTATDRVGAKQRGRAADR